MIQVVQTEEQIYVFKGLVRGQNTPVVCNTQNFTAANITIGI